MPCNGSPVNPPAGQRNPDQQSVGALRAVAVSVIWWDGCGDGPVPVSSRPGDGWAHDPPGRRQRPARRRQPAVSHRGGNRTEPPGRRQHRQTAHRRSQGERLALPAASCAMSAFEPRGLRLALLTYYLAYNY